MAPTQLLSPPLESPLDSGPAAADTRGLTDLVHASVDSPLGTLLVAATSDGLVRIALPAEDHDLVLEGLAAAISACVVERPARLDRARRQLDQYFEGRRTTFELALDWRLVRGFRRRVLRATARIPYGETSSYAAIAAAAGSPRAHRATGSALGANPLPLVVPCHRVLRSGGALGGFGGGLEAKRMLLSLERGLG